MNAAPKRRIDLDSVGMVWCVVEGEASIMAEPSMESGLPRASETLVRLGKGEYVFGISSEGMGNQIQVFVEASPGARLEPMMAEDFVEQCKADPDTSAQLVSRVIRQLSMFMNPDIPPAKVTKLLKPGGNFRLPKGMRVSSLSELWFRPEGDKCVYGDALEAGPLNKEAFHPLAGNMWVELGDKERLVCVSTKALILGSDFFEHFCAFSTRVITLAFEKFSQNAIFQLKHLVNSSRHRSEVFSKALDQAASVIQPDAGAGAGEARLLDAVQHVASALGASIEAPPRLREGFEQELEDILDHNAFLSRDVILSGRWHENQMNPLLGFIKRENQNPVPVALLPDRKGMSMKDPTTGLAVPITEELAQTISKNALQLYPPLPPGTLTPLKLTTLSFKGCKKELILVAVMGLLGGLCGFAIPLAMSTTVDTVIANGEHGLLWQIILGLIMVVFGNAVFELTKSTAMLRTETLAQIKLQSAILARLIRLPVDFFKKFPAGDLSNRVMAVDGIRQKLSGTMLVTLLSSVFALTNVVLLMIYSWQLGLSVLAILTATGFFTFLFMKRHMKFQSKVQNVIGKQAGLELQLITGISKLRAAGAESNAFARWMENFSELRKITYSIGKGTNVVQVYTSVLPLFTTLVVFALFTLSGMHRTLSLGSFLCFNAALGQLSAAVASLCTMAMSMMFIKPMYNRAKPILDAQPEVHSGLEDPGELQGRVEAANITYVYEGASEASLKNVSFQANPGEFIAIVGPSGSGKSTLLKLLLGFHKPRAGTILYDGKTLNRLDPVKIRRQIGSVIQNGELVQGNLYFNIMGADGKGTEDDAWAAAKLAAVDEDIRRMPMGMHTFVPHGGGTFSGGQKQRIMIARALSKKPKIFLLDEATSNLDNTSQAKVMDNLRHINATRIVVAHRLSTIRDADRIYVMHGGMVVESRTFDTLMEQNGLFKKLVSRQIS